MEPSLQPGHTVGRSRVWSCSHGRGRGRALAARPRLRPCRDIFDGLPLPNASPTRTDSALTLIAAGLPADFDGQQSLPSVTLGPPATAGYIELSPGPNLPHGSNTTYLGVAWNSDRDGGDALAVETGAQGRWSTRVAVAVHQLGDYTAGDGTVVPAADRNVGAVLHFDWQPDPQHALHLGALFSRQQLAVNAALPLDTRDTNTTAFTAGYDWAISADTRIDARLGAGVIRPHLDNTGRPAPALVTADGRRAVWRRGRRPAPDRRRRRIHRRRRRHPGGAPAGAQTPWRRRPALARPGTERCRSICGIHPRLTADWKLRLGARLDAADSDARAADGLAFNRSIRDLYVAYNGPDAVQTNRSETAGAANALLTGRLAPAVTTTLGAGFSRQPPGASERYRAFSDALGGGYEIGNPAAKAEDKYELDWGLHWQQPQLTVSLDLFASYLPDYLHRTRVGITTPPAPPPPGSVVYGYRATAATFLGGELDVLWQPVADTWWRLAAAERRGHRPQGSPPICRKSRRRPSRWPPVTAGPVHRLKPWVEWEYALPPPSTIPRRTTCRSSPTPRPSLSATCGAA